MMLLKTLSHKYVVTVFWTHLFQYRDREFSFCEHGDEYWRPKNIGTTYFYEFSNNKIPVRLKLRMKAKLS